MIRPGKQLIKIGIMTFVAGVFFCCTRVFAVFDVVDNLATTLDSYPDQTYRIMADYCNQVLSSQPFAQGEFVYNAKQSLFVYLICRNILNDPKPGSSNIDGEFLVRKTFKELGFVSLGVSKDKDNDYCNPPLVLSNDCKLSKTVPNLFNDIINDYVNMKQATLYGLTRDFKDDTEIESMINDVYSMPYFGIEICDKNVQNPYTKTCRMMKSYIKNARNILSEVRILDTAKFLNMTSGDMAPNTKTRPSCSSKDTDLNLIYCGFKNDEASMFSFINLVYNELFYYRMFVGYYLTILQRNPQILADSAHNNNYASISKKLSSQYIRSKNALSLSLRMMRDMYVTFPLHVGLTMYQERLDTFGKALARIAPPIYTLYDKLRNVQKPQ